MSVEAAPLGEISARPTHQAGTQDGPLLAPRPPDSQAQPPLPTFPWPTPVDNGACFRQDSTSSGDSMGGAADKAEGAVAVMSEGAAVQPRAPWRRGNGASADEDDRHISALIHKTEAERDKNRRGWPPRASRAHPRTLLSPIDGSRGALDRAHLCILAYRARLCRTLLGLK